MADITFFFPSSGSPAHTPAYSDYWTDTSGAARFPMPTSKGASAISAQHPYHSVGNHYDLGGQWVSAAMSARSWNTGDTFEFAMVFQDGNAPTTSFATHLSIRVFNAAGDTEIGVLFEGEVNASGWNVTYQSRHCDGIALTGNVDMPEGGHLVIEVGGYSTYAGNYGADMVIGEGSSTALLLNDTQTDYDLYSWIAFTYGAGAPLDVGEYRTTTITMNWS